MLSLCVYKNNKEKIEKKIKFINYKNEMAKYISSTRTLNEDTWDMLGLYLGIYTYIEYKKNQKYLQKILLLHESLNKKNFWECLSIIDINNYEELTAKGLKALDEFINFLNLAQTKVEDDTLKM